MVRQGKSPHVVVGQGNLLEGKKKSEANTLIVIISRKHQLIKLNIKLNIYSGDLVPTYAGLKLATSVFVSPNEPCLVVSVGCALLFFFLLPLILRISPPLFPRVSLISEGRDLMFASSLDSQYLALDIYICSHLLPEEASSRAIGQNGNLRPIRNPVCFLAIQAL